MIRKVEMYGVQCDHCKKDWYDDHNGWTVMPDETSMDSTLDEEGWHRGGMCNNGGKDGEYYCDKCWSYDDDDNFILAKDRKNKYESDILGVVD